MAATHLRRSLRQLAVAALIIACGLVLTLVPLGLPAFWVHYAGACLWGAMVLLIVGAILPGARFSGIAVSVAALIALATEVLRLYHTPALDAFRLTLPGALLLGRIFSPWNVVAYWLGILACLPLYAASFKRNRAPSIP